MAPDPTGILFLVPGFPKDEEDSTCLPPIQNYIAGVAEAYPEIQIHVLAFQYPFVRATYTWKGVTVHALGGKNRRFLFRLLPWIRAFWAFQRIRRTVNLRVVHSFWLTECTWLGQWLCRRATVPHVASIAGQDAKADNPYLKRLSMKDMTITAGSAFVADVFTRSSGYPVNEIIPLGLDTAHLEQFGAGEMRYIDILGVGSLIPLKEYATFIDIVERLLPAFPNLKTAIIGDGIERTALQQRIDEKGLSDHIALWGALPRDDVFQYMLRSKVFLHPSRYEGQGYVFLEALYAGLPIVCHDVGFKPESNRVYACTSAGAMKERILHLLQHPRPYHRVRVPSVRETVRTFKALYGLSSPKMRASD